MMVPFSRIVYLLPSKESKVTALGRRISEAAKLYYRHYNQTSGDKSSRQGQSKMMRPGHVAQNENWTKKVI